MKDLKAKDVMNTDVLSVRDDMTVQELAGFLTEREILGAPVVDPEGEVVGVVSCTDIVQSTTTEANMLLEKSTPGFYEHGWENKLDPDEMVRLQVEENESLPVMGNHDPNHLHRAGGYAGLGHCQGYGGRPNPQTSCDSRLSAGRNHYHPGHVEGLLRLNQ